MTRVAVGQMTSTTDIEENFKTVQSLIRDAAAAGAEMVCLPEAFSFLGDRDNQVLEVAEPLDGPFLGRYRALAKDHNVAVSFGGFCEAGPDDKHTYNTQVVVDAQGEITAWYRKIHLFDVDIPGGPKLLESNGTSPGEELVVCDSPIGKLGLTICYDLRFCEQYQRLAEMGAQIFLVPAAFTLTTGKEHWTCLLRARAIENQCYVIAAAQRGRHNQKRQSFGHAMIIDPWGTVIAQCADRSTVAVADIDLDYLSSVRTRMPIIKHRRPDIYGS